MKISSGKTLAVVAVAAGAVAASVVPVLAEVSGESPSNAVVKVESPAKLVADGAAVAVRLAFTCPEGLTVSGSVSVRQAVFGGVASGSNVHSHYYLRCTGREQSTTVNAIASKQGNRAFRWGSAWVAGSISGTGVVGGSDTREIKIGP